MAEHNKPLFGKELRALSEKLHEAPPVTVETAAGMADADLRASLKVHIEQGDHAAENAAGHYRSAGRIITELQRRYPKEWLKKSGLKKTRAYELLAIANGRTTVGAIRAGYNERNQRRRDKRLFSVSTRNPAKDTTTRPVTAAAHVTKPEPAGEKVKRIDDYRSPKASSTFDRRVGDGSEIEIYKSARDDLDAFLERYRNRLGDDILEAIETARRLIQEDLTEIHSGHMTILQ